MSEKLHMKELAIKLHKLGYHVIPTDKEKKPLTKWKERLTLEELEKVLEKANGIALVCGRNHPFGNQYTLVSMDIDNSTLLAFSPTLGKLLYNSMHVLTGPRCFLCGEKHLEIIEEGKKFKCSKCNVEFDSGKASRGFAVFFFVENSIADKYFGGTKREYKDVEFLINNYQLIAGKHPTGIDYELRKIDLNNTDLGITVLSENDLVELLNEIEKYKELKSRTEKKEKVEKIEEESKIELRELREEEIMQTITLLKDVYKPGVRQNIWLFLSGWGAKARIDYLSIARALYSLYRDCGDTDNLRMRLGAIVYSYEKEGIKVDKNRIVQLTGVEPYGPQELPQEEVKGKSGLYEIFISVGLKEEEAMDRIRKLEEIFGPSPFLDLILRILNYKNKTFAVADLRKKKTFIGELVEDSGKTKIRPIEDVLTGVITQVEIIVNPLVNVHKYIFKVAHHSLEEKKVGPITLKEFIEWLKNNGYVVSNTKVENVVSAVIDGFIKKGRAIITTDLDTPGFYLIKVDGRLVPKVVEYKLELPTKEEVREALQFLEYIRSEFFIDIEEKFLTAIKWHLIAPFSYIIKTLGESIPYLYLFGPSNTRKSTINLIGISLYGFRYSEIEEAEISGSSANTEATLGVWLSKGTFPVCIKEPFAIFNKPETLELIKSSCDGLIARARHRGSHFVQFHAFAPLAFSSNHFLPSEEGLIGKRIFLIEFSLDEALDRDNPDHSEKIDRFNSEIKPKLYKLSPIGRYIAYYLMQGDNYKILKKATWNNSKFLDVAEELLKKVYEYAEMQVPEWISKRYEQKSMSEFYEEIKTRIAQFLFDKINEAFHRLALKEDYVSTGDFIDRVRVVGTKRFIHWLIVGKKKDGNEYVFISSGIVEELSKKSGISYNLKSIAELFGWLYEKTSVYSAVNSKTLRNYFAYTTLENFVKSITIQIPEEFEENSENNPNQQDLS